VLCCARSPARSGVSALEPAEHGGRTGAPRSCAGRDVLSQPREPHSKLVRMIAPHPLKVARLVRERQSLRVRLYGLGFTRRRAQRASCSRVGRVRSPPRRDGAAETSRPFISVIAARLDLTALWRVASRTRRASRSPRWRGLGEVLSGEHASVLTPDEEHCGERALARRYGLGRAIRAHRRHHAHRHVLPGDHARRLGMRRATARRSIQRTLRPVRSMRHGDGSI
jgi:hypothetical protein